MGLAEVPCIPGKWKEGSRLARASARARTHCGLQVLPHNHNSFCCALYAKRAGCTRSVTHARKGVPRPRLCARGRAERAGKVHGLRAPLLSSGGQTGHSLTTSLRRAG